MRKTIFLLIALTLVGGGLIWLMYEDSGYLLIAFGQTSIEMSLWAAVLALLVIWVVLRIIRRIYIYLRKGGELVLSRDWFDRKGKSRQQTGRGLVELMEGRWTLARKNLLASVEHSDIPLVNLLGAANAAFELGDLTEVDHLLERAANATADDLAVEMVRARLLLRRGSHMAAIQVLEKSQRRHPNNSLILAMLAKGYPAAGEWQRLDAILHDLKRHKVLDNAAYSALQCQVSIERLRELSAPAKEGSLAGIPEEKQQAMYQDYWNQLPSTVRKDPAVQKVHVQCLYNSGKREEAEKLLVRMLHKNWDEDLVRLYGLLEGVDSANQLITAETWLADHSDSGQLMLTLARLSRRNELWGKTRDYLEKALSLSPSPEIYLDLAQLNARLGDHDKSAEYYRQGLQSIEA